MENKIKVVVVRPNEEARVEEIEQNLDSYQQIVDGWIECIYPFEEAVCLVCNDEGKFNGCLPNRALVDEDGNITDMIFGTFFIADCSGEQFESLSEEQLKKYTELFREPEQLCRMGGKYFVTRGDVFVGAI